ncbi:unnamed protein product [Adineta steineri]|uniref:Uncharacterized protein n=1 Tax=Adineta steineri TaxID=433720 RepID=A0A813ZDR4_9BILA|nr:unnamed protein product [Adineta steineri]CAF0961702.1 unnamed protein product [Adineta steineri]
MLRIKNDLQANLSQEKYVPLKQVNIEGKIHSFAADVTIKQIFRNDESTSIEAVYCFPIEEQAAIYSFIAQIDDREIEAKLKEKKEAQKQYNDALQQGHGAYLLEQNENSQDNFIINIGALPPGKECHITISYVTELELIENGKKIRFVIPTTIAPRYNPTKGEITSPAGTNYKYVQSSPYTIQFQCEIEKKNISSVSSSSHPIQVDLSQQDYYLIKFSQDKTYLDRDILVDINLIENHSNTILAIESNALMVSFTPNEKDCQQAMNNDNNIEITNEFVFIVDCSGSMIDENKIGFARQSMLLFLKSLPLNSYFNIIRFGSNYKLLFNDATVIYNEENCKQAEQMINKMEADLGGTELVKPLKWLEAHEPKEGRSRQIFLLTDGEISNVNEVLNLCRSMSKSCRIFSFGLGKCPSRSLVKGLARSTNGHFCFIPPSTNVDIYVGQELEKALQPSITNIEIKWNLSTQIITAPTNIPPVYLNDRLIIYGLINDESFIFNHNTTIELYKNNKKLSQAKITQIPHIINNNKTIQRLAGKALILELQHSKLPSSSIRKGSQQIRFEEYNEKIIKSSDDDKEEIKKRIIELSLKYNILSPYTSFIGIEKRVNGNNDEMILREIPIQISADDQHLQTLGFIQTGYAQSINFGQNTNNSNSNSNVQSTPFSFGGQSMQQQQSMPFGQYPNISNSNSTVQYVPFSFGGQPMHSPMQQQQPMTFGQNTNNSNSNSIVETAPFLFGARPVHPPIQQQQSMPFGQYPNNSNSNSTIPCAVFSFGGQPMHSPMQQQQSIFQSTPLNSMVLPEACQSYRSTLKAPHSDLSYEDTDEMSINNPRKKKKEEENFPTDDQDIVRYLIHKQNFNGLWNFDSETIKKLTGKSLDEFQQSTNEELVISTIIIIILLETRFSSFSSMSHAIIQKARKQILDLLGKDNNKLQNLFDDIRKQF